MPSTDEVEKVMSSSDHRKKTEMLSKAVVAITKKNQNLEQDHLRLVAELARTQAELNNAKEEISKLRQTKGRDSGLRHSPPLLDSANQPHFGQQVLKGLSSFVGVSAEGSGSPTGNGVESPPLSPEEIAKLLSENQYLHRVVTEYRSKQEAAAVIIKRESSLKQEERIRLQSDLASLQSQLQTATIAKDRLECLTSQQKGMLAVFEHFFRPSPSSFSPQPLPVELTHPSASLAQKLPNAKEEVVDKVVGLYWNRIHRLCSCLTVWMASIKNLLSSTAHRHPLSSRGSSQPSSRGSVKNGGDVTLLSPGHLRNLMDRLDDLQVLHAALKERIKEQWRVVLELLAVPENLLEEGEGSLSKGENDWVAFGKSEKGVSAPAGESNRAKDSSCKSYEGKSDILHSPATALCWGMADLVETIADWLELVRLNLPLLHGATAAVGKVERCANFGDLLPGGGCQSLVASSSEKKTASTDDGHSELEACEKEALATTEGVLRGIRNVLNQLLVELAAHVEPESTLGCSKDQPNEAAQLCSEWVLLLSRITSPDAFFSILSWMLKTLYSCPGLYDVLLRYSAALQAAAPNFDSTHLRNVFNFLLGEVQHWILSLKPEHSKNEAIKLGECRVPLDTDAAAAHHTLDSVEAVRSDSSHSLETCTENKEMLLELLALLESADETVMDLYRQLRSSEKELVEARHTIALQTRLIKELKKDLQ